VISHKHKVHAIPSKLRLTGKREYFMKKVAFAHHGWTMQANPTS
jgi:hypothetical protein